MIMFRRGCAMGMMIAWITVMNSKTAPSPHAVGMSSSVNPGDVFRNPSNVIQTMIVEISQVQLTRIIASRFGKNKL